MRIASINVTADLSTGRIAADICRMAQHYGHQTLLCYSRGYPPTDVPSYRVGERVHRPAKPARPPKPRKAGKGRRLSVRLPDAPTVNRLTPIVGRLTPLIDRADALSVSMGVRLHALGARLTDHSGFFSRRATRRLIRQLELYKPDVIHLHNLHGYYLNVELLFRWLAKTDIPVVWTLHDCWAYTGHCAYYSMAGCDRWQKGCDRCPQLGAYPASWFVDDSARNWLRKRAAFTSVPRMTLVTPSYWLADEVHHSFLGRHDIHVIPSGVDLHRFRPYDEPERLRGVIERFHLDRLGDRHIILSVASTWERRKGVDDLFELSTLLRPDIQLVMVGLSQAQLEHLPDSILGLPRTANLRDLVALYTIADAVLSMSYEETQGMTLIEALACGTQVIARDATALPETVTPDVGALFTDVEGAAAACAALCDAPKDAAACRARALEYDRAKAYSPYVWLYEEAYRRRYDNACLSQSPKG